MLDDAFHHAIDRAETAPFHERNASPCCGNWGVCYTALQAERWADANLRRNGYVTYLPLVTVTRRDRVFRSLRHTVEVPAYPRYLFVQHDNPDLWRPIRETPGVAAVLQCGSRMQYARTGDVEAVRMALAAQPPSKHFWTLGAPCSLNGGAFGGMPAVVTAIDGNTATIGLMMLGHLRQITVPIDSLRSRDDG